MQYNLRLSDEDLRIVNDALVEMPFKAVVKLINKINSQIANSKDSSQTEDPLPELDG